MRLVMLQKYVVRALTYGPPADARTIAPGKVGSSGKAAKDLVLAQSTSGAPDHGYGRWECFVEKETLGEHVHLHLYWGLARQLTSSGYQGLEPFSRLRFVNPITTLMDPRGSVTPIGEAIEIASLPFALEEDPRDTWWQAVEVPYYPLVGEKMVPELRAAKPAPERSETKERRRVPVDIRSLLSLPRRNAA